MSQVIPQAKYKPLDKLLEHWAAAQAAVTADDVTVGEIIDLGDDTHTEAETKIRVESIDTTTGDEFYNFTVELSTSPTFAQVDRVAARVHLGSDSVIGENSDTEAGANRCVTWSNNVDGQLYRYMRLSLDVGGTSPSIAYHAYTTLAG